MRWQLPVPLASSISTCHLELYVLAIWNNLFLLKHILILPMRMSWHIILNPPVNTDSLTLKFNAILLSKLKLSEKLTFPIYILCVLWPQYQCILLVQSIFLFHYNCWLMFPSPPTTYIKIIDFVLCICFSLLFMSYPTGFPYFVLEFSKSTTASLSTQ